MTPVLFGTVRRYAREAASDCRHNQTYEPPRPQRAPALGPFAKWPPTSRRWWHGSPRPGELKGVSGGGKIFLDLGFLAYILREATNRALFRGFFLGLQLLGLQHVGLTAICLSHIQKALGDFGVRDSPRHALSLSRLLPEEFRFFHHRVAQCQRIGDILTDDPNTKPENKHEHLRPLKQNLMVSPARAPTSGTVPICGTFLPYPLRPQPFPGALSFTLHQFRH